jgi:hypothetical protein
MQTFAKLNGNQPNKFFLTESGQDNTTMQNTDRSTNLRKRLPPVGYVAARLAAEPVDPTDVDFVATVKLAVTKLPATMRGTGAKAPKRHRVTQQFDNCIRALQGLIREAHENDADSDDIFRVSAAIERATRDYVKKLRPSLRGAPNYKMAIVAETAVNGQQNEHSNSVLISGTLGEVEKLWESSRVQRDLSQTVMEAAEERAAELRARAK